MTDIPPFSLQNLAERQPPSPQLDLFDNDGGRDMDLFTQHMWKLQEHNLRRTPRAVGKLNALAGARRSTPRKRLQPLAETYPWRWPAPERIERERPEPSGPHWLGPRQLLPCEEQRAAFNTLFESIHGQITHGLSRPCPVFSDGETVRTELLDCTAWVTDRRGRAVYTEVRDRRGQWIRSRLKIDISDPLSDLLWLDQVMLGWASRIEQAFQGSAPEAFWKLQFLLAQTFNRQDWLQPTCRQVRHHLGVSSRLVSAIAQVGRFSRSVGCDNETYSRFWQEETAWNNLAEHYPGLMHLYYVARRDGLLGQDANLGGLRAKCRQLGLSRAGWCFLCRFGVSAYSAMLEEAEEAQQRVGRIVAYVDWQARAGLDAPLDPAFGALLLVEYHFTRDRDGRFAVGVDPRLARVAAALSGISDEDAFWSAVDDFDSVLSWMKEQRPRLDRNQWRSGWPAIYQQYLKWVRSTRPAVRWKPQLASFTHGAWRIRELCDSSELAYEGARMHHCAGNYVNRCCAGGYLLYAVERSQSGESVATVSFKRKKKGWRFDQARGKCNTDMSAQVKQTVDEILERLSALH